MVTWSVDGAEAGDSYLEGYQRWLEDRIATTPSSLDLYLETFRYIIRFADGVEDGRGLGEAITAPERLGKGCEAKVDMERPAVEGFVEGLRKQTMIEALEVYYDETLKEDDRRKKCRRLSKLGVEELKLEVEANLSRETPEIFSAITEVDDAIKQTKKRGVADTTVFRRKLDESILKSDTVPEYQQWQFFQSWIDQFFAYRVRLQGGRSKTAAEHAWAAFTILDEGRGINADKARGIKATASMQWDGVGAGDDGATHVGQIKKKFFRYIMGEMGEGEERKFEIGMETLTKGANGVPYVDSLFAQKKEQIYDDAIERYKRASFSKAVTKLRSVKEQEDDKYKENRLILRWLGGLRPQVHDLLRQLRFTIRGQGALGLYVFPTLESYHETMESAARKWSSCQPGSLEHTSPHSSLDSPLLQIVPSEESKELAQDPALRFFNFQDRSALYLVAAEPELRGKVVLFKEKNSVHVDMADKVEREQLRAPSGSPLGREKEFKLNFSRRYEPLYLLTQNERSNEEKIVTHLLWRPNSAGFRPGIGRADGARPKDYRWAFLGFESLKKEAEKADVELPPNASVELLGSFLGLDESCFLREELDGAPKSQIVRDSPRIAADSLFVHPIHSFADKEYVECNAPLSYSKSGEDGAAFQFRYYRRVGSFNSSSAETGKQVVKSAWSLNRPGIGDVSGPKNGDDEIGVNLPIALGLSENRNRFRKTKRKRAALKNKGNFLGRAGSKRIAAGTVMGRIIKSLDSGPGPLKSPLSANALARHLFLRGRSKRARSDWQGIKATDQYLIPTDQEWCHLLGHGDGGTERIGNFVSGSKHCNTEQLAMELALRAVTQTEEGKEKYLLKTSAYLLRDQSMGSRAMADDDDTYETLSSKNIELNLASWEKRDAFWKQCESEGNEGKTARTRDEREEASRLKKLVETQRGKVTDLRDVLDDELETRGKDLPKHLEIQLTSKGPRIPLRDENGKASVKLVNALSKLDAGETLKESLQKILLIPAFHKTLLARKAEDQKRVGGNAPMAAFFLYKVYRKQDGGYAKVFEHAFEGQSDFFDRNQYMILSAAVRYRLDRKVFLEELKGFCESCLESEDDASGQSTGRAR